MSRGDRSASSMLSLIRASSVPTLSLFLEGVHSLFIKLNRRSTQAVDVGISLPKLYRYCTAGNEFMYSGLVKSSAKSCSSRCLLKKKIQKHHNFSILHLTEKSLNVEWKEMITE